MGGGGRIAEPVHKLVESIFLQWRQLGWPRWDMNLSWEGTYPTKIKTQKGGQKLPIINYCRYYAAVTAVVCCRQYSADTTVFCGQYAAESVKITFKSYCCQ